VGEVCRTLGGAAVLGGREGPRSKERKVDRLTLDTQYINAIWCNTGSLIIKFSTNSTALLGWVPHDLQRKSETPAVDHALRLVPDKAEFRTDQNHLASDPAV